MFYRLVTSVGQRKKFRVPNEESNLRPSDSGEEASEKIDTFFHASLFPRARLALASRLPEELTEMTPVLHISWRMFTSPGCDVSPSQVTF